MDSLTQAVLGASVTVAVMGRHTTFAKAAAVGAIAGTLPDLDVLIDHGDDLLNMVRHRAESHALFFLTLLAPVLGWLTCRLLHRHTPPGTPRPLARWCWAWWLALVTHVGIDAMTSYGTQFLQPFTDHAFAVGSVFIIDPLYTVPLVVGLVWAGLRARRGLPWGAPNAWALALSCGYLLWSVGAQQHVRTLAQSSLAAQGLQGAQLWVYPTPFNTVLWRVLAVTPTHSYEGFYSLLDADPHIPLTATERGQPYLERWGQVPHVQQLLRFTQGPVRLQVADGRVRMTDLRMGQEPHYTFTFDLGTPAQLDAGSAGPALRAPMTVRANFEGQSLWGRMLGRQGQGQGPAPVPDSAARTAP